MTKKRLKKNILDKNIEESLKDVKRGRVKSIELIAKELNIKL